MADLDSWLSRLDAVEARLRALATPTEGLTGPDPATGEQWEAAQVWGHVTEFIPFWIEQAGDVIDAFQLCLLDELPGLPGAELTVVGIGDESFGDRIPFTVAWHAKDGEPAVVDYGAGSLRVPG